MRRLALLPSARLVSLEMQVEFGAIPPAMIPLNGRPALSYIAEKYRQSGYDIAVAVGEGAQRIHDYLADEQSVQARVLDIGASSSLGETIAKALLMLEQLPDILAINFADTLLEDTLTAGDTVFYARKGDTYRWTTFCLTDEQGIVGISDKNYEKPGADHPPVFVGVFIVQDVASFLRDLQQALAAPPKEDIDAFYQALRTYFNRLSREARQFVEAAYWWDFGHPDTYYETKRKAFTRGRSFNRVTIDESRGVLRKESDNVSKFHDEIRWYLRLPKSLQYLTPRIFDYSLDFDCPFVEMEFYGYPVVSDVYLYGAWDEGIWAQLFQGLRKTVERMGEYACSPVERSELVTAMREMYETKTAQRLGPVLSDARFARFCRDCITINGKRCMGLPVGLAQLPSLIEATGLYRHDHFAIIHGDLCLSNILYDSRNRIIRLIDPRGGFGAFDIYGDTRYDLAKLDHSLQGDYDFYVNGLFDLQWPADDELVLHPHLRPSHEVIKRIYRREMKQAMQSCQQQAQLQLIEGLLFLSMVPLHRDRPRSQEAFLARGLLSLSTVAQELGLLPWA